MRGVLQAEKLDGGLAHLEPLVLAGGGHWALLGDVDVAGTTRSVMRP